jgi:hypothetical protein
MSVMQDVFTKAINTTPTEQQESLREDMTYLRNSWEQLSIDLSSVMAQLKVIIVFFVNYNNKNKNKIALVKRSQERFQAHSSSALDKGDSFVSWKLLLFRGKYT